MTWVELGFIAYTSGVTFAVCFAQRDHICIFGHFWILKVHLKMYVIVLH